MMKITEAITESIETDSIIHIDVDAPDIYAAMDGVEYEDAILNDGVWDVWGADWRLAITLTD